jgi:hypothetical protein
MAQIDKLNIIKNLLIQFLEKITFSGFINIKNTKDSYNYYSYLDDNHYFQNFQVKTCLVFFIYYY